ncbi:MAG TPA: large-conductance mechanosensitive channel protein MscL [Pirellulaceae bacterium]
MGMIKEFKEFALKGNMIDMAVGIIIGAAFSGVVGSLVENMFSPVLGLLTGGIDFSEFKYPLKVAADAKDNVYLQWGAFVQSLINFLVQALALFLIVKSINTAKKNFEREQAAAPAAPSAEVKLLTEIRDALRHR